MSPALCVPVNPRVQRGRKLSTGRVATAGTTARASFGRAGGEPTSLSSNDSGSRVATRDSNVGSMLTATVGTVEARIHFHGVQRDSTAPPSMATPTTRIGCLRAIGTIA